MFEYKVVWQREGKPKRSKIYQTLEGAKGCIRVQNTASEEITWGYDPVPPLIGDPILYYREVGVWE